MTLFGGLTTHHQVDPNKDIAQLAEYLLGEAMATKAPLLAYNHFVEALFMLNDCRLHPSYHTSGVAAGASERERTLFSLVGNAPHIRAQRRMVYEVLARRMSAEHRLATAAKITQVGESLAFNASLDFNHLQSS